ncbi:MAG: FtsW/RodA/SpoVE family cell cycle protein, partial [Bacillota bacterium]
MYFVEKTKDFNFFKRFDYPLFIAVIILSVIGSVVLSSAVNTMSSGRRMLMVQVGCLVIGAVLSVLISFIDYKDFRVLGILFYIFTIALLVLVLIIGTGDNLGSRSWLNVAGFSFQPSELAKISFILVSSVFLERIYDGQKNKNANIAKLLLYSAIPMALVLAQKDFGTTMVFVFVFFVMVFICGL